MEVVVWVVSGLLLCFIVIVLIGFIAAPAEPVAGDELHKPRIRLARMFLMGLALEKWWRDE